MPRDGSLTPRDLVGELVAQGNRREFNSKRLRHGLDSGELADARR